MMSVVDKHFDNIKTNKSDNCKAHVRWQIERGYSKSNKVQNRVNHNNVQEELHIESHLLWVMHVKDKISKAPRKLMEMRPYRKGCRYISHKVLQIFHNHELCKIIIKTYSQIWQFRYLFKAMSPHLEYQLIKKKKS